MVKMLFSALARAAAGLVLLGLLLFLPAGTLAYPNAWLLIALLFVPMILIALFLFLRAPELLRKRMEAKEKNTEQRAIILLSSLLFVLVFALSGLDKRFGWSRLPLWIVIASSALFLAGYGLYAEVLRENAYLSRTVEIQANQKVIDTGLYGVVRHPMYFATLLLFLSIPLVLGSLLAFLLMLFAYPPIIIWRIRDEERTLSEGLEGYRDYVRKVRHRLLPGIW